MPDATKWNHLTPEAVSMLSDKEWLKSAYHLACQGFVRGKSDVVAAHNGVWRVTADSMTTVADIVIHKEIVWGIHQLHAIRSLPVFKTIVPIAPTEVGTPLAMLKSIPYRQMPENLWREFAWRMAVDPETAQTTQVCGWDNGICRVRCYSEHAWELLHYPDAILGMMAWISRIRPLPQIRQIVPLLGELKQMAEEKNCDIIDDSDIPASIKEPELRRILARLRPVKK